ncbi:FlgO family outer membrane protein [Candidatus Magnetaquicoccus inordinatus]|uniref:FlgO family outer membrane protein n=1 Tax=Candidatus Magnetaquicoccus inordinatus TaxID=2496818 RepID=UPI00102C083B|nr:FlgO family outer membrane protein [Candidatus Magnetaquicoccus inordinatus]
MNKLMNIHPLRFALSALAPLALAMGLTVAALPAAAGTLSSALNLEPQPGSSFLEVPAAANGEADLIRVGYMLADGLVAELRKNHPPLGYHHPLLVATFVNRSNMDLSSEMGMVMADHVSSRITQHGYTVLEPKLRKEFSIRKEHGEFMLSRDIDKLFQENRAYAAVVGSYTESRSLLDFTVKIVEIKTRHVLASADLRLPLGENARDLLMSLGGGTNMEVVDK